MRVAGKDFIITFFSIDELQLEVRHLILASPPPPPWSWPSSTLLLIPADQWYLLTKAFCFCASQSYRRF